MRSLGFTLFTAYPTHRRYFYIHEEGEGSVLSQGLSLPELVHMFPGDATLQWSLGLPATRWPDGPQCPRCASDRVQSVAAHKTMSYRCRVCRKFFSVRTGTVMAESKLGYQTWILAIYLLTTGIKGTSSMKLHCNFRGNAKDGAAFGTLHPHLVASRRFFLIWPR